MEGALLLRASSAGVLVLPVLISRFVAATRHSCSAVSTLGAARKAAAAAPACGCNRNMLHTQIPKAPSAKESQKQKVPNKREAESIWTKYLDLRR